jgi:hypothetical protein
MKPFVQQISIVFLLSTATFLLSSCASTKITQSWVDPDIETLYKDLLIIGVSQSEQTRRAYESYFVEELRENAIEAEASYRLIKSNEEIDRDTVKNAIKGLDIDGVLVTHMVAVDEETIYRPSAGYAYGGAYGGYYRGGHYGSLYSYYPHVNGYVHDPGYYTTHETYTLETSLYDVKTEELVWTARTRTFSPESVDEVIADLTTLLIKDLQEKNLIKKK